MSSQDPRNESGASAVEYGLLITGIAAVIAVAVFLLGGAVNNQLYKNSCDKIAVQVSQAPC